MVGAHPFAQTAQDLCNLQLTEEERQSNHMFFYIFCCVTKGFTCCWALWHYAVMFFVLFYYLIFLVFMCAIWFGLWIKCMCNIIGILVRSTNQTKDSRTKWCTLWFEPLRAFFPQKLVSFTLRVRVSRDIFDWPCLPWQAYCIRFIIEL
jgi:hypothetical protein